MKSALNISSLSTVHLALCTCSLASVQQGDFSARVLYAQLGQAAREWGHQRFVTDQALVVPIVCGVFKRPASPEMARERGYNSRKGVGLECVAVQVVGSRNVALEQGPQCRSRVCHEGAGRNPLLTHSNVPLLLLLGLELGQHVVASPAGVDLPADSSDDRVGIGFEYSVFTAHLIAPVIVLSAAEVCRAVRSVGVVVENHRGAGED